jgi:exodeoxyribonuclease VII small subunit
VHNAKEEEEAKSTFEEALSRLEEIVESMEEGEIPLADLLEKYEEGNRLLQICGKRLRDAELKIELLKKSAQSESLEPFESGTA